MVERIYENEDFLICLKPRGLVSEQTPDKKGLADLLALENGGYIGVIHRLDRDVGGLTVYAKHPRAASFLSTALQEHRLKKEYVILICGKPETDTEALRDLLYYDRSKNKVYPVRGMRRGVKEAVLTYTVENTWDTPVYGTVSQISVLPLTGRTHQIRVQFASRGFPLIGDRRYGGKPADKIHLWCRKLIIPTADGEQCFTAEPDWQNTI